MKSVLVSVVIATFNSAKYLDKVLEAIRNQSVDQQQIEILVVDGGSSDRTLEIATRFGCKIVNNPKTEPVYAKYIGACEAQGKYIVYIDHDEVLTNRNSFKKRIELIESRPNTFAAITSGYINPTGFAELNNYINDFGDPFSFFIYRLSKREGFFEKTLRDRYKILAENDEGVWFDYLSSKLPLIELCAAAGMIVANHAKRLIGTNVELIPHMFYLGLKQDLTVVFSKDDNITHYSVEKISSYIRKISWRIKNNIYHKKMGESGFSGRGEFDNNWKQYLYIPYIFTVVPVLIDTVALVLSRKSLEYAVHVPLSIHTGGSIMYHLIKHSLGFREELKSYDGKKNI
jgi:glycosyltransferase involved in cell wall biosynthesis